MTGRRMKSIGITILIGANDSAFVRQKCANRPAKPIRMTHGNTIADGNAMFPSQPAPMRPKAACITVSQNMIQVMDCVRVNLRVKIAVNANEIAAQAAAKVPIDISVWNGCVTIITPINPNLAARTLMYENRSPSKNGASKITQIGEVNSSAKSWVSEIRGRAKNHRFCPMKCARLRLTCKLNCWQFNWLNVPAIVAIVSTTTIPVTLRNNMISKVSSSTLTARPAIAIDVNEIIAPVIQRAAREISDITVFQVLVSAASLI